MPKLDSRCRVCRHELILLSLSTFVLDVIFTYSTYFKLTSFPWLNEKEKIQVIGNDLYNRQLAI